MKIILVYLWRLWFVVLGILLVLTLGVAIYLLTFFENQHKNIYRLLRVGCKIMFYGMGFSYELIKATQKKIDKNKQYIIIANHTSVIDVFLPCILLPEHSLFYVGKKELEKIPIFGRIYKKIMVTVDRKDPESRVEVYTKCAEHMRMGKNLVIFPEGGVTDDLSVVLQDFKNGAFNMAVQHQIPILVYTFIDLKYMFPFDNSKGYPGKVKVYFNEILEPTDEMEVLKQKAWSLINNTLHKNL